MCFMFFLVLDLIANATIMDKKPSRQKDQGPRTQETERYPTLEQVYKTSAPTPAPPKPTPAPPKKEKSNDYEWVPKAQGKNYSAEGSTNTSVYSQKSNPSYSRNEYDDEYERDDDDYDDYEEQGGDYQDYYEDSGARNNRGGSRYNAYEPKNTGSGSKGSNYQPNSSKQTQNNPVYDSRYEAKPVPRESTELATANSREPQNEKNHMMYKQFLKRSEEDLRKGARGSGSIKVVMVAEKPSIARSVSEALTRNFQQTQGRSKFCPVFCFPLNFMGQHAECRVTSVAGHVYNREFPEEFQDWRGVDPQQLFDVPTIRKVANPKVHWTILLG